MPKPQKFNLLMFVLISLLTIKPVVAQEDAFNKFKTDSVVTYTVGNDGITSVDHDITITNLKADLIVSSYTISLKEDVDNVSGKSKDRKVEVAKTEEDGITKLTARFNDFIIGMDKKNFLNIDYTSKKTATKIGNIWNVNIPKIGERVDNNNYSVKLIVPDAFGPQLYVSPQPDNIEKQGTNTMLTFQKDKIVKNGITASYGTYQQINFRLIYQLQNPNYLKTAYDVTLPPEIQNFQQIKLTSIKPEPKKISVDDQGNTIATFDLKSKEKIEVELIGNAKISGRQIDPINGGYFKSMPNSVKKYLGQSKYWPTKTEQIETLAKSMRDDKLTVSQNAYKIYQYILDNYKYDFSISEKKGIDRKGAANALIDKNGWGCMEFTDVFIALARSMGIPARQLNGYALTKDEDTKPLSVVLTSGDRLHAWPEFYDPNYGWVQIDPTWGSTSGVDYFTKLDTNHFTFVIRGNDSEYPLSAGEYRTDNDKRLVEVDFPENTNASEDDFKPKLTVSKAFSLNPIAWLKGESLYKVQNNGQVFIHLENNKILPPGESGTIYIPKNSKTMQIKDFNNKQTAYPII